METMVMLLRAVLAFFLVLAGWFLWMSYVRRKSGLRRDKDVLEHMTHSCSGCQNQGRCHNKKTEEEHHELA
jgi:hypothetical protein